MAARAREEGDAAWQLQQEGGEAQEQRPPQPRATAGGSSARKPRTKLVASVCDRLGCGRPWLELASRESLAAAACTQWRWFVSRAVRRRAAARQRARWLQLSALAALTSAVSHARALRRQALLLGCKHQFMVLAACFDTWAQRAAQRRRLAQLEAAFKERRWAGPTYNG